jgi:nitric oxide reductase subunit B
MSYKKLWFGLFTVVAGSFAVLGYYGREIYRQAPPLPTQIVTTTGEIVYTGEQIRDGQNVWQSMGGQEVGSVWGHGAYVAPDWSADWLHREATWLLDHWARTEHQTLYDSLTAEQQAALRVRLEKELRTNTYNAESEDLVVSPLRAKAIAAVADHYTHLFGDDPRLDELRAAYAIPRDALKTDDRKQAITAFFFWASWACVTNRPDADFTYTHNWPAEPLVGNGPTASIFASSAISVVMLLAGVGALAWYMAVKRHNTEPEPHYPQTDPLFGLKRTPSMRATLKYF